MQQAALFHHESENACKYSWVKQVQEFHPVLGATTLGPTHVLKVAQDAGLHVPTGQSRSVSVDDAIVDRLDFLVLLPQGAKVMKNAKMTTKLC